MGRAAEEGRAAQAGRGEAGVTPFLIAAVAAYNLICTGTETSGQPDPNVFGKGITRHVLPKCTASILAWAVGVEATVAKRAPSIASRRHRFSSRRMKLLEVRNLPSQSARMAFSSYAENWLMGKHPRGVVRTGAVFWILSCCRFHGHEVKLLAAAARSPSG